MNSFGRLFRISIYGESHSEEMGIIVDGMPSGISISKEDFINDLQRRKPGKLATTSRIEDDEVIIKSGVFNGVTTGGPICLSILNKNIKSKDYDQFKDIYRPGHADFVANHKYNGFNDYRGSGFFSGRLTALLVAAGVLAKKVTNYKIESNIVKLHNETDEKLFEEVLKEAVKNNDSVGGTVQIVVNNPDVGLGQPYFDSAESIISHILYSVGGVKGVSFGVGFDGSSLLGSEFNDSFINKDGKTLTNNNGGINGGITNGNNLVVNMFVKPTSSIIKTQNTYNFKEGKMDDLNITGRHDGALILRTPVVLEACVMIALADLFLINKLYNQKD